MIYNAMYMIRIILVFTQTKQKKWKKKKGQKIEEKKETKKHTNRNINFKERLQNVMFVDVNTSLVWNYAWRSTLSFYTFDL